MTRKELKRIHEACEMIENKDERFSCIAIEWGKNSGLVAPVKPMTGLVQRYGEFCDGRPSDAYPWFQDIEDAEEKRNARILTMLMFAEADGDI